MSTTENKSSRGKYNKREEKIYWGVYWLNHAKHSMREISRLMEIPYTTVTSIVKRIQERDTPLPSAPPGSTSKADERTMRHLNRIVTHNPFLSIDGVSHELEKLEVTVCRKTVVSYLRQLGFKSYYAAHKPALTKKHKEFRLKWAKEHVDWTTDQWADVVWSDESRYTVEGADGGVREIGRAHV